MLASSEAYPANSRHLSWPCLWSGDWSISLASSAKRDHCIAAVRIQGDMLCAFHGADGTPPIEGGLANPTQSFSGAAHRNMQPARTVYVGRLITCGQNMARPNQPLDGVDLSFGGEAAIATSAGPGASILNSGSLHTHLLAKDPQLRTHFQLSTARVANVA